TEERKTAARERALAQHAAMTEEEKRERSANISMATTKAMADPVVRTKISVKLFGRTHSKERIAITSRTVKLAHERNPERWINAIAAMNRSSKNTGKKHSIKTRQQMSESQL